MTFTTVREATRELLRAAGMTTVFGNPGSTEMKFFRDWPADFRYVLGLQESCVVAMADGYAQATGRAAFVNLHSAAGVGHALGSVFTAFRNRTPLVITAGQQTRAMFPTDPYLFAADAPEFPRPYVKWSVEPARAADVPAAIQRAWHVAMQPPRGPVFVSVPEDDWDAPAEPLEVRRVLSEAEPPAAALDEFARALGSARAPALVVGAAADRAGAWHALVRLAQRLGALVWTSPMVGRVGFPEDHPLYAGHLPPLRQPLADCLAPHDVVLVVGAPVFTYHVHTGGEHVHPGTRVLLLADDPSEAARAATGLAATGAIAPGIEGLLRRLGEGEPRQQRGRLPAPAADPAVLDGDLVMDTLDRLLPAGALVVEEAPTHRNALWTRFRVRAPASFFAAESGGLGWAVAAAPGIALAHPGRPVVCVVGDGSALFGIQGLWTAARQGLPVVCLVLNNRGYGALRSFGRMLGIPEAPGHDLDGVDFLDLASGFGCRGERVSGAADLAPVLERALQGGGTWVLDVVLDGASVNLY